MNRLFWGIVFLVLAAGGWAQSTWRGQAELWKAANVPAEGFLAASNEFPRNSLLSVENYKTKKTVQVRVVSNLPVGSSALVLLNPKAAAALDMKAGDSPLVGVRMDPSGIERPDNPDPDVNPLAAKPLAVKPTTPAVAVAPVAVPTATPVAPAAAVAKPDPDLLPLPSVASPEPLPVPSSVADPLPVTELSTPLPVVVEPEPTPVTPGRKVFVTTRDPEPVAAETPLVTVKPSVTETTPGVDTVPVVETAPVAEPAESAKPAPTVVAEVPVAAPEATPVAAPVPPPVAVAPPVAPVAPPAVPVASSAATVVPVKPTSASAWVDKPAKLEGPLLGQVAILAALEKGKSYVQVGTWAKEADILKALDTLKSYVPLALYKAEGEKNPWRLVVESAPKAQLGMLLMHFRSQGFKSASVVKG